MFLIDPLFPLIYSINEVTLQGFLGGVGIHCILSFACNGLGVW